VEPMYKIGGEVNVAPRVGFNSRSKEIGAYRCEVICHKFLIVANRAMVVRRSKKYF
jgi:hypothetical protein